MLKLKRLAVWFLEISCEALLLSLLLIGLSVPFQPGQFGLGAELLSSFGVIANWLFWRTGYLFTTAIVAVFFRGQKLWVYPAVAALLFVIHIEIVMVKLGSDLASTYGILIPAAGACIVFACTFAGSLILRRWARGR